MTDAAAAPSAAADMAPFPLVVDASAVRRARLRWAIALAAAFVCLLALSALLLAWQTQQRVQDLERELVRRQQSIETDAAEARVFAKEAKADMRDATAKVALLEARLAEVTVQRSQVDELLQSLLRSRDDNALTEVDADIRMALRQTAITGSAEPLVTALKQADERLAHLNQPRLETVRRALAHDLDRLRAQSGADIPSLAGKLDEAVRLADEAPLLVAAMPLNPSRNAGNTSPGPERSSDAPPAALAASSPAGWLSGWGRTWRSDVGVALLRVWNEVRSLVRVSRIDRPDAVLLAPDQAYFVRENVKLRLLGGRLALQGHQFEAAQLDLQAAASSFERYFDPSSKRTLLARSLVAQVLSEARQIDLPRPDDTLAAITVLTNVSAPMLPAAPAR